MSEIDTLHELRDVLLAARFWHAISHRRIEADRQVLIRAGSYHGGMLRATSGGTASVTVYDAQSAEATAFLDELRATASDHDAHFYERGIVIQNDLFVDVGSNVADFVLFYLPPPRELG